VAQTNFLLDTIRSIEKQRPLTQAELLEVQRQRKKVRNREYAQNCRSKKKQALESAQETNERLNQEKAELHTALLEVQRDNQRLLYENTQLKVILSVSFLFTGTAIFFYPPRDRGFLRPSIF
jgi:hypothetical protein